MITEKEKEFIKLLRPKIDGDWELGAAMSSVSRERKVTEKCVEFMRANPDATVDDVQALIWPEEFKDMDEED